MRKIEQSDFIDWELRWRSGKESAYQCRRLRRRGFHPWVRKIPWRRKWQPTPVFLPGKIPWTKEPGGLKSMGSQRVGHDWIHTAQRCEEGTLVPWPTFSCTRSSRHSDVIHGGKGSDNRFSPFLAPCYKVYRGAVACDTLSCLQSYHGWFTCASTKALSLTGTLDPIYLFKGISSSILPSTSCVVMFSTISGSFPAASEHTVIVQSLSLVWLFATPWTAARQASLSITNSRSSLKLMSIESVMPSNRLILCRPLLLLPSIFPSIRVFSKKSVLCIKWPKYWSFSFSISPSNEYSGLISFRMDRLALLAVQGTLTIISFPKISISCPVSPSTHCPISVFAFSAKCSRERSLFTLSTSSSPFSLEPVQQGC